MTNKQYEHIGRAVMAEVRLEAMSAAMDDLRTELQQHLAAITDPDAAAAFVTKHYGVQLALWRNGRDFMDALRGVWAENVKREAANGR